ncbi:hypothetical protein Tco_0255677 [Tanacetum coccineum]
MQSSTDRFLRRNIPPFGSNKPSSNYGRGKKEQNSANEVCNSKMSFAVQHHNKKNQNEKPHSVEEGRFLRHVVTKEGIRTDLEKFIPKLAKLKYLINKVHMRLDAATESDWTNKAKEALQVIKRNFAKKEFMKKAFQDMLHGLGEVNPTHAYYNGSITSKDNEDPSWSTSFKTRRTQKTSSALEAL